MRQLDLLPIPRQPEPRELEIASRTIRAFVKQNLRNFATRQAERATKRKQQQERYEKNRKAKPVTEPIHMRQIRVTYRAVFEQPIGPLNPMGLKLYGPHPVEIFGKSESWQAREITTPHRQVFKQLGKFVSLAHAKTILADSFRTQLQDWQMWGTPPEPGAVERLLLPDEVHVCIEDVFWPQTEDFTHIIHAPTIPSGARIPPAACGATVAAKCFINNRANVRPSCKACAQIWEKEYRDK